MADQNQIEKDRALIDSLGGASKVAELLSYPSEGGIQRVQNWKVRGIPPAVKVGHPDIFLRVEMGAEPSTQTPTAEQGAA